MNDSYPESESPKKPSALKGWLIAGAIGAGVLALAAQSGPKTPQLPELKNTSLETERVMLGACSQGHARVGFERTVDFHGQKMRVDCPEFWRPRGMQMP